MACRFIFFVLPAFFVLSCSQEPPVSSLSSAVAEEAGPWQTVSINGAVYRRVAAAAKPTETTQADLLITIPISYTVSGGSLRFADTVQIAGRTYTADCSSTGGGGGVGATGDDVGNTRATATPLTVRYEGDRFYLSPWYELTRGDTDYFRMNITESVTIGISSWGETDTYGLLQDANGNTIDANDDGVGVYEDDDDLNFFLFRNRLNPGIYYVRVTGASSNTSGSYQLSVLTFAPSASKVVVAQRMTEKAVVAQRMTEKMERERR